MGSGQKEGKINGYLPNASDEPLAKDSANAASSSLILNYASVSTRKLGVRAIFFPHHLRSIFL